MKPTPMLRSDFLRCALLTVFFVLACGNRLISLDNLALSLHFSTVEREWRSDSTTAVIHQCTGHISSHTSSTISYGGSMSTAFDWLQRHKLHSERGLHACRAFLRVYNSRNHVISSSPCPSMDAKLWLGLISILTTTVVAWA